MSLDLYEAELNDRRSLMGSTQTIEPGAFTNFFSGAGSAAMRTFAQGGRALTLAAGGVASAVERIGAMHPLNRTGEVDTSLSDAIWKFHDDVSQRAVDYWTPSPGEVGVAGEIVGQLAATLPLVIANPSAAVALTQMATAEDLARKGVETGTAGAVGAVQGAGLGLGIWMPILGQNLLQRVLVGGAGFNVAQGAVTRGISEAMLENTPGAEDFKAFDPTAITLDVLLGAAFGAITHLSPRQRAEGAAMWQKVTDWGKTLKPSDVEALATLRQAQHLNADTLPGIPDGPASNEAHYQRMKTAVQQLLVDEPVQVDNLPGGRFEPDAARMAEAEKNGAALTEIAERVRVDEGVPRAIETEGPPAARSVEPPRNAETQPAGPTARADEAEAPDPLAYSADRVATLYPDAHFDVEVDDNGTRKTLSLSPQDYLALMREDVAQAQQDAGLFQAAAACLFGKG